MNWKRLKELEEIYRKETGKEPTEEWYASQGDDTGDFMNFYTERFLFWLIGKIPE